MLTFSLRNFALFCSNVADVLAQGAPSVESDNDLRIKDAELPCAVSKIKFAMRSIEKIAMAWMIAVPAGNISKENVSIVATF